MNSPFKKAINQVPLEIAHWWSWTRRLLLSKLDLISKNIEAVTKWYLEVGKAFDWHMHENIDEFFIVLKWNWIISFENGNVIKYKEDDLIYIPANIKHKIETLWTTNNEFLFVRVLS